MADQQIVFNLKIVAIGLKKRKYIQYLQSWQYTDGFNHVTVTS